MAAPLNRWLAENFAWPLRGRGSQPQPPAIVGRSPQSSTVLAGDTVVSLDQLYRTQPWVYICVNKLARSMAQVALRAYMSDGSARLPSTNPQLAQLLVEPAPDTSMFQLVESVMLNVCIFGNAVTIIERGRSGEWAEWWPTNMIDFTVTPGVTRPINAYIHRQWLGEPRLFSPQDVIHFRYGNLNSYLLGMSPLEPLRRTVTVEDAAQRLAVDAFDNAGLQRGYLSTQLTFDDNKPADAAALARLRAQLDEMRGPEGASKIALFEGGLNFNTTAKDFDDIAVVPHRKLNQIEVAAAFDIPPPLVGILDHATYSNIATQREMLYADTLGSHISSFEQAVQVQGLRRFADLDGHFVAFDIRERLRGTPLERMRAYQLMQWFMTPNEIRALENIAPIADPEADRIHVPLSTTTEVSDPANQQDAQAQMQRLIDKLEDTHDIVELAEWIVQADAVMPLPAEAGPLLLEWANGKTDSIALLRAAYTEGDAE